MISRFDTSRMLNQLLSGLKTKFVNKWIPAVKLEQFVQTYEIVLIKIKMDKQWINLNDKSIWHVQNVESVALRFKN